jgi:hypothetical protein
MSFEKIRLGIEEIFTVTVQDQTGKVIDKWTALKKDFNQVVRILNTKYGLDIFKNKKDKDLDWAVKF